MNRLNVYLSTASSNVEKNSGYALLLFLTISLMLITGNVRANEEALYGPVAPPGSAFIRLFNNAPSTALSAIIGGKQLDVDGAYSASGYQFLPAGEYSLEMKSLSRQLTLDADHYYTAYVDASGKIAVVEGRGFDQRKKALIAFYNLTASPLSLKTANGKGTVVADVASNESGFREVNAVKIGLAAFINEEKIVDAKPVVLKRGKTFSLFAIGNSNDRPALVWVQE